MRRQEDEAELKSLKPTQWNFNRKFSWRKKDKQERGIRGKEGKNVSIRMGNKR